MEDSSMTHSDASETRRLRTWMIGAVLWAVTFAWLGAYFFGWIKPPGAEGTAARSGDDAAAKLSDSASGDDETSGKRDSKVVELVPEEDTGTSPWDPQGIADFELTERSGKTVTKKDLLGHPWIVGFIFTRCAGPCPLVTGQMALLQQRLKDSDVRLVTITVDPKNDTPEVLTRYADLYQADPEKWLFLTGDQDKIYKLIIESFKMPVEEQTGEDRKPGYEVLHTTNILRVNAAGVVVGKYNVLSGAELAQLRRDLKEDLESKPQQDAGRDTESPEEESD
jgi:protein SCO1/2/putative membrane protein